MPVSRLLPALLLLSTAATAFAADDIALPIGRVQGSGERSPLEGRTVTIEGVVTGNFGDGLGGFFVQDGGDGDARTSDAIFVVAGDVTAPVHAGERLRVRGQVFEDAADNHGHGSVTALRAESIEALGHGEVAALALAAPPADWEALEGMRVRIDAPLTLGGVDTRFGETIASFGGPLWTPSEIAAPAGAGYAHAEQDNAKRRIVLDDASDRRDPERIWYLPAGAPRGGSVLHGVEGIVDQRHGTYRLQLTAPPQVAAAPRPDAPKVGGTLRVAVFNMENYFNGDGNGGGFPTARGAKTLRQWQAQTAKLVATMRGLDADIAALMELENDGYGPRSSLAQFVDALNAGDGTASDWRYVDAGHGPGEDAIRVGLVYRASRVTPLGEAATLQGGPFGTRSRVPLAQAFRRGDGPAFVVVANHFKSKGCAEAEGADADQHDGQGCWNALRSDSARRLDAWMRTDPTGHGGELALLAGDFNAYAMEDPVRALRDAGWRDAFATAHVAQPYSYVYDGQRGRLDHALLSPALAQRLKGAAEWHSNADEAHAEGYAGEDVSGPWRSSDHDPMLLGFDL